MEVVWENIPLQTECSFNNLIPLVSNPYTATNDTVNNLTAVWKDSDAFVSWIPLSVPKTKEFLLYIVSYSSRSGSRPGSVNTTNSSVSISGLDPQVEYTFTVQVIAGNGYYIRQPTKGQDPNILSYYTSYLVCLL